jgi:hypothetical protein
MSYIMAMHRLSGIARHKPVPVPALLASLVLAVLAVALITTCNLPLTFGDEYRDSTVNFIADRVLADPPDAIIDEIAVPLDTLGIWDWGWRTQTGNTYQYMNATELGAGTGPGGSSTAWLLEAVNLAQNPAFAGGLTTGWGASGGAIISGTGFIHLNSLEATTVDESQFIYTNSSLFIDPLDTNSHIYSLAMNATGTTGLRFFEAESLALYVSESLRPTGWDGAGPFHVELSGISDTSTQVLTFSNLVSTFQFDDISAIRTDVLPRKWSLVLRLGLNDTDPALVPGIYEFAVYVKRPLTHTFSTDPARDDSPNYAARFVTLRMTQTAGGKIETVAEQSFNISTLSDPDIWNQLVLRMPTGSNFTFPESTTGGAIELSISPMNPSFAEAGAVLIADPSLHFYINGY